MEKVNIPLFINKHAKRTHVLKNIFVNKSTINDCSHCYNYIFINYCK